MRSDILMYYCNHLDYIILNMFISQYDLFFIATIICIIDQKNKLSEQ